jgi:hypothetical protein
MNHSGDQAFFKGGRLNPFGVPAIREAMHYIIDHAYIAREIMDRHFIPGRSWAGVDPEVLLPGVPDGSQRYPDLMPNLEVVMPKFTFRSKFLLGRTLAKLEMPSAFSSGADFSGMEETGEIFIGKVTHEVFIAVNDDGTEAAAATAMPFVATGPGKVLVERPFVFLIRDSGTGTILSLGRVVAPGDDHHALEPCTSPQARFI